jgi:hypothetical protein
MPVIKAVIRAIVFVFCVCVASCTGLAWNTEVASTETARLSMAASVLPGQTTEKGLVTRWGNPTQKVREGGQTEFIYRSMKNPPGWYVPHNYVIVTFQYGLASGVRTSDGIECRGTFPPRPPSYVLDNPSTVRLVGACSGGLSEQADRRGPWSTLWRKLNRNWGATTAATEVPGVQEDRYDAGVNDRK